MAELLTAVALLGWLLVGLGIARGLYLVGQGAYANWQGGLKAVCADRLVRKGGTLLSAAGSCGGFLTVAIGWPL